MSERVDSRYNNFYLTHGEPVHKEDIFNDGYSEGARSQRELMACRHPKACWVEKRTEPTCKSVGERYDETYAGHYCTTCAKLADLRESERKLREVATKAETIAFWLDGHTDIYYDKVSRIWVGKIGTVMSQGRSEIEAFKAVVSAFKLKVRALLAPPAPAKGEAK